MRSFTAVQDDKILDAWNFVASNYIILQKGIDDNPYLPKNILKIKKEARKELLSLRFMAQQTCCLSAHRKA
jgi:hypothetical protein